VRRADTALIGFRVYDLRAFLWLTNFSSQRLSFSLRVSIDGKPVSAQTIALDPLVKRNMVVSFTHQGGGQIRVEALRRARPGGRQPGLRVDHGSARGFW
jgi:hypothetical protein